MRLRFSWWWLWRSHSSEILTPHSLAKLYSHVGGTYCLHLQTAMWVSVHSTTQHQIGGKVVVLLFISVKVVVQYMHFKHHLCFLFYYNFVCAGIFYTRVPGSSSRRYGSYHQAARPDCITNSTFRFVHPNSSSKGTSLSWAIPKATWGMFCWNAKSCWIQIWKKGIALASLEDIFLSDVFFVILHSL